MSRSRRRLGSFHYLAWRLRRAVRQSPDRIVRTIAAAMQLPVKKWTTPWILIPAFGLVAGIAAAVYAWTIPDTFVSTSVIGLGNGYIVGVGEEEQIASGRPSQWWFTDARAAARQQEILSRRSLRRLIHEEGLYRQELAQMSAEDLVEKMRDSAIRIGPVPGTRRRFSISFAGPTAELAQGATWNLAAQFVDGTSFPVLAVADLPRHPDGPNRFQITSLGLLGGVLLGALAVLVTKLRILVLAMALGIAGAAIPFLVPPQYTSIALVRYSGPDGWSGMREVIAEATTDFALNTVEITFKVYPYNSQAVSRLKDHMRIQPTKEADAQAVMISFADSSPELATKIVSALASRIIDGSRTSESRVKAELLDPASLPADPSSPDRPVAAATGFALGLACAIALGIWRHHKGSFPWDAVQLSIAARRRSEPSRFDLS